MATLSKNLLQVLQMRTKVDCDTMDAEVAKNLGPFVDCTSNQAIAFFELSKPTHKEDIKKVIELSKKMVDDYPGVTPTELAVEIAMVKLQLVISQFVTGFVHVQTNPIHSFDTEKMVTNARRIIGIFKYLNASFDTKRVCIKVPSTWEGLQACQELEASGTTTLATTLFNMEQVVLAGEVGCHYIAPYLNELKVHFEKGFIDENKAGRLCFEAQEYYEDQKLGTQVLVASLTSVQEIMEVAGVHHITISPGLLEELVASSGTEMKPPSFFDVKEAHVKNTLKLGPFKNDEGGFKSAFQASDNGEGARKLKEAIDIFCDMQKRLEVMLS